MSFEQIVKVPTERVGAIIGREGAMRRSLEEDLGVQLRVDSKEGTVLVRADSMGEADPLNAVRVIGR
jgi:ribosomal RNA assembly protein